MMLGFGLPSLPLQEIFIFCCGLLFAYVKSVKNPEAMVNMSGENNKLMVVIIMVGPADWCER